MKWLVIPKVFSAVSGRPCERKPIFYVTHYISDCVVTSIGTEFTLLYNVKSGSSNKSFGLEVAKLAGFPDEVVAKAKIYLEEAEMPLLRTQGAVDKTEIAEFLSEWKDDTVDKKRKAEMLEYMKAKVSKASAAAAAAAAADKA